MSYIYDLTDTWNAGGTVFTAIKMNVTNSASASGSKVISLQVNGTEQFSVDKGGKGYVAGNLGIGTSSPADKLDVTTSARISGATALFSLWNAGSVDRYGYLYGTSSGLQLSCESGGGSNIQFLTAGSERLRIDASGNVGIGTSSPRANFDVGTNTGGSTTTTMHLGYSGLNFYGYRLANTMNPSLEGAGNLTFQYGTSAAWVDVVTIKEGGNVGIGTSSPADKLDVNGTIRIRGGNYLFLNNSANDSLSVIYNSGGSGAGNLQFNTGGSERMRIDASGNVGIGTSSPTLQFQVGARGGMGSSGVFYWGQDLTGSNRGFLSWDTNIASVNAASSLVFGTSGGTERARIDTSGNLLVGCTSTAFAGGASTGLYLTNSTSQAGGLHIKNLSNNTAAEVVRFYGWDGSQSGSIQTYVNVTSYNTSSDARLKHDIVDAPEASALIDQIKVRSFKWNADDSEQRYGFIAQELVEVAPEAVSVPADEEQMMGVDYSKLVPMLVKEIQSLRARVAQLEGK